MRHCSLQLPLTAPWIAQAHAVDLAAMSAVLDAQPALARAFSKTWKRAARRMRGRDARA